MSKRRDNRFVRFAAPSNSSFGGMIYSSSVRGVTKEELGGDIVYWGTSVRIPKLVAGTKNQLQYDRDPEVLAQAIPKAGHVPPGGIVERYEAWDIETGDLIVMWRIPYIESRPGPASRRSQDT